MKSVFNELHIELFDALKVGLAINDMDGNLVYVNKAFADLIGYEKEEVLKLSYWDITPKQYDKLEQFQLKSLAESKQYGPYDKEYIHKNGQLIPVRLNGKIISFDGNDYIWSSVEDTIFSKSKEVLLNLESKSKLIDESTNEIFICDYQTYKFIYANEEAKRNTGYSLAELSLMTPIGLKPDFDEGNFKEHISSLVNNKTDKLTFETIHQRKDGSSYHVEIHLQKGFYEGKAVFVAFAQDINYKKKMEIEQRKVLEELDKSLQFERVIQNNVAYPIIATTPEGVITSFNRAAEKMLGYTSEEMVLKQTPEVFHDKEEVIQRAKEFSDLIGSKVEPGFRTFICLTERGMPNEYEWTYVRKDGSKLPVLLSVTALRNKNKQITGFLGIASNITDRKHREAEITQAKLNAEKALAIKSEFLANMSHEIRTPMNGIIGMSELLQDQLITGQALDQVKIINESAKSLLIIINDILDISKIEANKIKIERNNFNIKSLISETIEIYSASVYEKDVQLKFFITSDVPQFIIADELRIRQVLNNLLSNAVKFTTRGTIKLQLEVVLDFNNKVSLQFSVADSGIGIDQKNYEEVFRSFSQADSSTTRHFGGTGLGLTICKSLVSLMDGRIWVTSNELGGSTFMFQIPLVKGVYEKEEKDERQVSDGKLGDEIPLSILVVEDNSVNQKVVTGFLQSFGYHSDIANNGQEAINKVAQKKYDLVLMDCHMPILDGFQATEQILSKYGVSAPYIIALSASAMKEDIEKCYKAGMCGFLAKPLVKQDLKEILHSLKIKKA